MPKEQKRKVGKQGAGSPGDIRDRFRDVYQPGAHPPPKPGLKMPWDILPKRKPPQPPGRPLKPKVKPRPAQPSRDPNI